MKAPNKQEWIKEEHQKAVQVHWDNIDRIKKLKDEQSTKIYRIHSYQRTINTLQDEFQPDYDHGKHELSEELIREEQLKHCIEVVDLQKQIDKHPFEASLKIMNRDGDEDMLADKYDELYVKEVNQ